MTFVETDVDDRIKQLQRAGIEPKSVVRGEQVSLAIITDLDGNQVVMQTDLCGASMKALKPLSA